jgi:hypothetical protein
MVCAESIIPQEGFLLLPMQFADILILSFSVIVLVYFLYDRSKYSNRDVYFEKLERLEELKKTILAIQKENEETEEIIKSITAGTVYDNEMIDKFASYSDNQGKLKDLKTEQRKIEWYLRYAGRYINSFGEWP